MTARPTPRSVLVFASLLALALAAASCARTVYFVQQPDGTFVEATADEALHQVAARQASAQPGAPAIVVRNPDGSLAPLPLDQTPAQGQIVVIDAPGGAVAHGDGTVTVAVDPQLGSTLPDDVVIVDVAVSNALVMVDGESPHYLQVTLSGVDGRGGERVPLDLAIVIDRSGSMAGQKLRDVKQAAGWLVDNLADDDHVALVSYASDVRLEGSGTLEEGGRARLKEAIDALHDGGGTNLSGGLVAGCDALESAMREHDRGDARGLSRVVLLSDGNANEGIVDRSALAQLADGYRERGVSVTTMGVGLDYNEELMEAVALSGGGNYYFIESSQALASVFEHELDTLGRTVARDTVVTLTLPEGVRLSRVFGFRHEQVGAEVRVLLNALAAGETRRLLVELDVPAGKAGEPLVLAEAAVAYHDALADAPVHRALGPVEVRYTGDPQALASNHDAAVVEKIERVLSAEVRREVFAQLDAGNRAAAESLVKTRKAELAQTNESLDSPALDAELQALDALEQTVEEMPAEAEAARQHRNSGDFKRAKKKNRTEAIDLLVE